MCSILGIFGLQPGDDIGALRRQALDLSQKQRHRGPDWSGVYMDDALECLKHRFPGPTPRDFDSIVLAKGPGICI